MATGTTPGSGSGGATSELKRLLLTRYSLAKDGSVKLDKDTKFEAQINPAEFTHSFGIQYDKTTSQGSASLDPKFSRVDDERLSLTIVLDGTGVVPAVPDQPPDVKGQLAKLTKVVYEYVELKSEPPLVRLLWGTLIFFGRLESLKSQYTLFKPGGDPLRAKVDMSFVGAMSKEEERRITSRASTSELTRTVTTKAGDSLGAICERVYGEQPHTVFMQVARYNGLTDFRNIPPGTVLKLPPLRA
ncbi:peptidoglycan-binding protein [Pelomonas sp. HMWF004]|nr:peptidoglycan-binding protein [Pelomonas sp. HMWF004]